MISFTIHNQICSNLDLPKIRDLFRKRNFNKKDHSINHESNIKMKKKINVDTLKYQEVPQNNFPHVKKKSENKLFRLILLQILLFSYILKGFEYNTEEKNITLTYKPLEKKRPIAKQKGRKIKNRILEEKNDEEDINAIVIKYLFGTKELKEKNADLPIIVVQECKEYLRLLKEIKDKVFLNNAESESIINNLRNRRMVVAIYVPQLLDKNETQIIENIKVLKYFTKEPPSRNSRIQKLSNTLNDYILGMHFLQEILIASTQEERNKRQYNANQYYNRLKQVDKHSYFVIRKRLQQYKRTFEKDTKLTPEEIFKKEEGIFIDAIYLCHRYMDILQELSRNRNRISPLFREDLYNFEQGLLRRVPEFYYLYELHETT